MMKKLNNYYLLKKKYVTMLCHCILFFCLQLKLSFAQTNDFNKEVVIVDDFSNFEDNFGNKISSAKSKFLLNERLLKIKSVKMIDEINNKYFFKNALNTFC